MVQTDDKTRVILLGASGRMGRVIADRFTQDGRIRMVGLVDPAGVGGKFWDYTGIGVGGPEGYKAVREIPSNLEADVVVDFSVADGTRENVGPCLERGWDMIIGTTGFDEKDLRNFRELAEKHSRRVLLVPNFTLGVNLLMKMVEMAAKVFPKVEIIEMHHDRKLDAPSGTAIYTAKIISEARKAVEVREQGSMDDRSRGRDEDGIPIHAVRLPGLLAHQEVVFGSEGEVLTIRHDTTDRGAFLTGIYLAIERLNELPPGLEIGLGWIFG